MKMEIGILPNRDVNRTSTTMCKSMPVNVNGGEIIFVKRYPRIGSNRKFLKSFAEFLLVFIHLSLNPLCLKPSGDLLDPPISNRVSNRFTEKPLKMIDGINNEGTLRVLMPVACRVHDSVGKDTKFTPK